jgi:hypothetical protein
MKALEDPRELIIFDGALTGNVKNVLECIVDDTGILSKNYYGLSLLHFGAVGGNPQIVSAAKTYGALDLVHRRDPVRVLIYNCSDPKSARIHSSMVCNLEQKC